MRPVIAACNHVAAHRDPALRVVAKVRSHVTGRLDVAQQSLAVAAPVIAVGAGFSATGNLSNACIHSPFDLSEELHVLFSFCTTQSQSRYGSS